MVESIHMLCFFHSFIEMQFDFVVELYFRLKTNKQTQGSRRVQEAYLPVHEK